MGFSGTKHITTLSDSNFYRKIVQKYQTSKKKTFRFPTMIFYKGKNSVSPKKFDIILKFNFHLNQQKILSLLILKNIPDMKRRISKLNNEIEPLKLVLKLKNVQSNNYVTKIFLTALKIPKGSSVASEQFLAGNTSPNKITVFSFLKSLISRSGNIANNSNNILNSSFLRVSNILYYQKTSTIFPDIIIRDPKILNYENKMKISKSQIFDRQVLCDWCFEPPECQ